MVNPILESNTYRRDLGEAQALEEDLRYRFYELTDARNIATGAGLDATKIDLTGAPSTFWAAILDHAAKMVQLEKLLESVERNLEPAPKDGRVRSSIERVRQITAAEGSLSAVRLLLSGDRPFIGRTKLRGHVAELRNWSSPASILVVRGEPDSGRTETQLLLGEGRDPAREKFVLLNQNMTLKSCLRQIWKAAGLSDPVPSPQEEALTTESGMLMDFWTDVKEALDDKNRMLWVLFDDLDKGAGRVDARTLAEVLAMRFSDISFQKRLRLVLLGYPDAQLTSKVSATLVRNDETDKIDDSHVQAFVDYCVKARGKRVSDVAAAATDIANKAKANTSETVPYLEALNVELRAWYQDV